MFLVTNIVIVGVVSSSLSSLSCDYRLATFPRILAAFARLNNHIRKLFNLGCFADVVKNG